MLIEMRGSHDHADSLLRDDFVAELDINAGKIYEVYAVLRGCNISLATMSRECVFRSEDKSLIVFSARSGLPDKKMVIGHQMFVIGYRYLIRTTFGEDRESLHYPRWKRVCVAGYEHPVGDVDLCTIYDSGYTVEMFCEKMV